MTSQPKPRPWSSGTGDPRTAAVITTIGRPKLLERLLASLWEQTHPVATVIVVDQSGDNETLRVVESWRDRLPVRRMVSGRGASLGRNTGLADLRDHDVVVFPDDDSWYASDAFAQALSVLDQGAGVASGRLLSPAGEPVQLAFGKRAAVLDDRTVWRMAIAETCFFRAEVLEQVGGFGEELGIGCAAPWQSGAETDLLLRVMRAGWRVVYDPRVAAYEENPDDPEPGGRAFRAKARHAARGTGRVYRLNYGAGRCLQTVVRALGAAVMYACRRRWARAAWYLQQAIGRVEGITGLILPAPAPFGPQNRRSSAR